MADHIDTVQFQLFITQCRTNEWEIRTNVRQLGQTGHLAIGRRWGKARAYSEVARMAEAINPSVAEVERLKADLLQRGRKALDEAALTNDVYNKAYGETLIGLAKELGKLLE
jgi:hypothetical protein